jgi:cell division protein ZapA
MPMVSVTINGRSYEIACDPGQEEQLRRLAADLAGRVNQLVESVGQVGDAQLMLMAGLLVADELETTRQGGNGHPPGQAQADQAELEALTDAIGDLASRVEAIAEKLAAT